MTRGRASPPPELAESPHAIKTRSPTRGINNRSRLTGRRLDANENRCQFHQRDPDLGTRRGALDVSDDFPHLCAAEGGTGGLRGVRQPDLSHLLSRLLFLEEDHGQALAILCRRQPVPRQESRYLLKFRQHRLQILQPLCLAASFKICGYK